MSKLPRQLLFWGLALVAAWAGPAGAADDRAQQRARIAAERRDVNQRYEAARKACEQRFAVTTCLDDARSERRRALDRLAGEQAVLDDAQRRQRAAERLRSIQDKASQADERATAPATPASKVQRVPPARQATRPLAPVQAESRPAITPEQAERRRNEQARRVQEAQAHREAVAKRNAARDAKKPPAAPLPVPSAPVRGKP